MMARSRPRPERDSRLHCPRPTWTSPAEAFRTQNRLSTLSGRGLYSHTVHVALLLLTAAAALSVRAADTVVLVEDGVARAVIVLPRDAHADEALAARELHDHVLAMSGASLEITTERTADGRLPIQVGQALCPWVGAGAEAAEAHPDTAVVDVSDERVAVVGHSPQGTLFAAYDLLESFGVRWFLPGDLGTVIPKRTTLTLPAGVRRHRPSFSSRHLQAIPRELPWYRRQRLGGPYFPGSHGIRLKPRLGQEETHLRALVNGQRNGRQLCIAQPEVLDRATAYVLDYFDTHPEEPWIGLGPNDGGGFCECARCRQLDSGEWDPFSAEPAMTDRTIWFFNQILERIEGRYPTKKIGFYCYHTYKLPPRKWAPDPRIVPAFAPITLCRIHGMSNPVCPDRSFYAQLMRDWNAMVPETFERGYYFNLAGIQLPFSKIHAVRDEIRRAEQFGVDGWRVECKASWACTGPTLYVAARLMWDVDADVDALLEDVCTRFFDAAAEPMAAYLTLVDHAFRDTDCHTGGSFCMPRVFSADVVERAEALLAEAAGRTGGDTMLEQRVGMFRDNHRRLVLFLRMLDAEGRGDFAEAKVAHDRLSALTERMVATELVRVPGQRKNRPATATLLEERAAAGYLKRFWTPAVQSGFERVVERGSLVAMCPDLWDAQIDPKGVGEVLRWYRDGRIGGNWQPMRTRTASWGDQGLHYYKGQAWYRCGVTLPAIQEGKRVFLWFAGVDEAAAVWLNGTLLGTNTDPGDGLPGVAGVFRPFEFDVTAEVRPGILNTVAVKITNEALNEIGTGGIVGPVLFWAEH